MAGTCLILAIFTREKKQQLAWHVLTFSYFHETKNALASATFRRFHETSTKVPWHVPAFSHFHETSTKVPWHVPTFSYFHETSTKSALARAYF